MDTGDSPLVIDGKHTIRSAKQKLQLLYLHAQARMDLQAADEKRNVLREETRLKSFQNRCIADFETSNKSFSVLDLIVEAEQSDNTGIDEKVLLTKLHAAYNKS